MGYDKSGSQFQYFNPAGTGIVGNITVSAAAASAGEYVCVKPCDVIKLQFTVSTAVVGTTTAPTVVFTKRPTTGSAASAVAVGTLTLPTGTAAGKTVYKLVTPVNFQIGNGLEIAWTQAAGSPAGIGQASAICIDDPETEANNSNEIASA